MATQSLIQYLEAGNGASTMNRSQVETFLASEAIAVGDLVSMDLSQLNDGDKALYVSKADTGTATDTCAIGFALNAATAVGDKVDVTIAGIHVSANVDGATVAGSKLCAGSTAGRAAIYVNTDVLPIVAIACEADTANVATVFVLKQF